VDFLDDVIRELHETGKVFGLTLSAIGLVDVVACIAHFVKYGMKNKLCVYNAYIYFNFYMSF
jgi:hypothetical protein